MQMRPEIQIGSMIKALKDVVMPALDPANKLALEQSQLIVGMLKLLASQLPLQFRFDRDELARLAGCADALGATASADPGVRAAIAHLEARNTAARGVLERCGLDPAALLASVRELRAAVGGLVKAAADAGDLDAALRIEKAILAMSKEQLLRDRALMKQQGFEPDPAALPDIELLLSKAGALP